ncbi:MAG TPA: hypothetical protein VK176_00865 [Phycisphaerales bacterium]|nr:hypothetical protein [Phycisphaerales bacterium]
MNAQDSNAAALTRPPRWICTLCIGSLLLPALGGCVSDDPSKPKLVDQPQWVRATNVVLNTEQPEDRNSDGYDDTIFVNVYVFDMDLRAQSIKVDCSYQFLLVDADGKSGMTWNVEREIVNSAYRLEAPGPMVRLRLNIPRTVAEDLGGKPYTILARLINPDGTTVESSGGSSFTLRTKGR